MWKWLYDFWRALLENNVVGLTPYGPRTRTYWLAKVVTLSVFIALMMLVFYSVLSGSLR